MPRLSLPGLPYGQPQPPKHPSPSWVTIDRGGVHRGLSTLRFRRFRFTCHFPARAAAEARAAAAMGGTRRGGAVAIRHRHHQVRLSRRSFHQRVLTAASSSRAASITAWNDVFVGLACSAGCGVAGALRPCCGSPVGPVVGVLRRSRERRLSSAGRPGLLEGPVQADGDPGPSGRPFLDGGRLGLLLGRRLRFAGIARGTLAIKVQCLSHGHTGREAGQEGDSALAGRLDRGLSTGMTDTVNSGAIRSNTELPEPRSWATCWNTPAVAAASTAPGDCTVVPASVWPESAGRAVSEPSGWFRLNASSVAASRPPKPRRS